MKRKGCPLLIQSDTQPSWTVYGESHTHSYMLQCIGEKCAAYGTQDGFCERFQHSTALSEEVDHATE